MDPVLNSLVQSPLVRTLASVPSKTSSYVHGIHDNVPPFSRDKVILRPYSKPAVVGGINSQNGTFRFKLPQLGYVDHLYLKIKMKSFNYRENADEINNYGITVYRDGVGTLDHIVSQTGAAVVSNFSGNNNANLNLKSYFRLPWNVLENEPATDDRYIKSAAPDYTVSWFKLGALIGSASNSWNVVKCLNNITLRTRNKIIETLPPEVIPFHVMQMPEGLKRFYKQTMVGFAAGNENAEFVDAMFENNVPLNRGIKLFDPTQLFAQAEVALDGTKGLFNPVPLGNQIAYSENTHAVFMLPLNFSVFSNLSKNLQTRFVEEMEIQVDTKEFGSGYNTWINNISSTDSAYYDMELHVVYRNWHDNIENSIRQANYKPSIPASIYASNWYIESPVTVPTTSSTVSIPLTCRNLTTQICIVAKINSTITTIFPYSEYSLDRSSTNNFYFKYELKGSGKTLWKSDNIDSQGPDALLFELDGNVNNTYASDAYQDHTVVRVVSECTQNSVQPTFSKNLSVVNFGLQSHDSFYTGGIALQTISNPSITIQLPVSHAEMIFTVYCRYANIINIDSDTGVITRTLDV